ncbi:hypothetical protein VTO42DRAFT_5176 [Malbranchea cinnamomea]
MRSWFSSIPVVNIVLIENKASLSDTNLLRMTSSAKPCARKGSSTTSGHRLSYAATHGLSHEDCKIRVGNVSSRKPIGGCRNSV